MRAKLGKPVIDRANQAVHITLPNGVTRTAKYLGSHLKERRYGTANWQQPQNSPQRALIDAKQVEHQRLVFALARVKNGKLRRRSKLFIEIPACRSCFV